MKSIIIFSRFYFSLLVFLMGNIFLFGQSGLMAYYPFNGNANDRSGNSHNEKILGNVTFTQPEILELTNSSNNNLLVGLEAYWKLDGNLEDSYGSNDWTDYGSVNILNGKINECRGFNEGSTTGQYCEAQSISLSSAASMSFWFYSYGNQPESAGVIFKVHGASLGDQSVFGAQAYNNGNELVFNATESSSGGGAAQYYTFSHNTWYHFVWVIDGANMETRLYVNGQKTTQACSFSSFYNPVTKMKMGIQKTNTRSFHGELDEIGIWNKALSDDDVYALYNNGYGNQYPFNEPINIFHGLMSFWKLDGDLMDNYGTNHWTDYGSQNNPEGKCNQARSFNQSTTGQYCEAPSISLSTAASLSFWFYSYGPQPESAGVIFKVHGAPLGDQSVFGAQAYNNGNELVFNVTKSSSGGGAAQYFTFSHNTWYHFVWVYDGADMETRLYVNGQKSTQGCSFSSFYNPVTKMKMGMQKTADRSFSGKLDEIGIWDRALNDDEVQFLYNNPCDYPYGLLLDLTAFLEGPYFNGQMTPWLNFQGFLPLQQPYCSYPWYYCGPESVPSIPNNEIVDWMLVELRDAPGGPETATSSTIIGRNAFFINKYGKFVNLEGSYPIYFNNLHINQNLYVVLIHRNHLSVMSNYSLVLTNGKYTYNFTDGSDKAYGGVNAHKEVDPGVWAMISGDGDADGQVNNQDKNDVWRPQSGGSGYLSGDFNMNGQVDNIDKINYWKPNTGRSAQVPE